MNVYTEQPPPYWWLPQKRTRRGHATRPRRNPRRPPWPVDCNRPGTRCEGERTMTPEETQPLKKFSEQWWANYTRGENRCVAHSKNGDQCRRPARLGANVCRHHGGAAPQVIAKARERLNLAADRMARELLGIATGAESEAVKLAAVKDALDRAGLAAKQNVEVGVQLKPWEQVMGDMVGVERVTQAESRARQGLPPLALAAPADEPVEVVDAELVDDEPPVARPSRGGAPRDGYDRADDPTDPAATPSKALVPLDDALGDTATANRANAARLGRIRRMR